MQKVLTKSTLILSEVLIVSLCTTVVPQHKTVLIIFPLILQTIIIAQMMSVGGEEDLSHCWATVCKTVRPMLSVRCLSVCLSVLSVTWVHCCQTVGRIKMKLGMQVGLGTGHIVLDGDPAPPPQRGTAPQFSANILRPNGCMDQDVTWYEARPRPRRLCVR